MLIDSVDEFDSPYEIRDVVMSALLFTTTFGTFGREYSPLGSQLVITMRRRQLAC